MSIHITFADGSNPYVVYNLPPEKFAREILKWAKRYDLIFEKALNSVLFFTATERQQGEYS